MSCWAGQVVGITVAIAGVLAVASCQRSPVIVHLPSTAQIISLPEQLQWGPAATGSMGDVRLDNGRVMAIVAAIDHAVGFAATGGNLVDVAWLPDGEDQINQVFLYLDDEFPRQAKYTSLEIVDPGAPGRTALVRARGTDSHNAQIDVETDYTLEPGADWVTLTTRFVSNATFTVSRYDLGDAIQWGRAEHLGPGTGFDLRGKRPRLPWVAGIGQGTSYAMVPTATLAFTGPHGSMWSDPIGAIVDLVPHSPVTYVRHLVVGRGDTASFAGSVAKLRNESTGTISGVAATRGGVAVPGTVIHVLNADEQLVGLAKVGPNGRYSIELVPEQYRLDAVTPGRTPVAPVGSRQVTLAASTTHIRDFQLEPPALIAWRIEGDDGRAPAVKLTFVGLDDTPSPEFGPIYMARASNVVLSPRGVGEAAVGAGRYRVLISKGPEYEVIDREIIAREGERPEIEARLERSVDSRGLISADLHQHSVPSFDSGVSLADRALSNAAEGVDVLVSTDHNVLTDYRPVIAALGLGRSLASIVGTEATTHSVGHFNALPMKMVRDHPRGGMIDVEGMSPNEIFAFVRKLSEPDVTAFIQTNHPRSGYIGYFDIMKLDPTRGTSDDPRFSLALDGLEVIAFGWKEETDAALADWFSLLRTGRRLTSTGASDSHTIVVREVGWPRTYVCTDDDNPTRLDTVAFTAALRRGCATVSAGPLVTIRSGAARMGDVVKAKRGTLEVEVDVQAPRWISTDRLTVFVDGNVVATVPLTSKEPRRLTQKFPIRCKADCFVLARVDGDTPLTPVLSAADGRTPTPVALTNPIYLDVDGDGLFHGAPR